MHAYDASKANPARVYDALLGGKDSFAADRAAAEQLAAKAPEVYQAVRADSGFLVRAVRFLAEQGIRQFLDLGSGFPTSPNVHEVARIIQPDARVMYVDHDAVVVAHGRAMHTASGAAAYADLRDPGERLRSPVVRKLIDFAEPVGVLAVAVLHFLDDHASVAAITRLRQVMAAGSYLVISHASPGTSTDVDDAAETYRKITAPIWVRTLLRGLRPGRAGVGAGAGMARGCRLDRRQGQQGHLVPGGVPRRRRPHPGAFDV